MKLEEKLSSAEKALSDGKPKLALHEIADIFEAINPKFGKQHAVKDAYETYVRIMSQYNRIENSYHDGVLSDVLHLQELNRIDGAIQVIINDLEDILMSIKEVVLEISLDKEDEINIKVREGYIFEEQKALQMLKKLAAHLNIDLKKYFK